MRKFVLIRIGVSLMVILIGLFCFVWQGLLIAHKWKRLHQQEKIIQMTHQLKEKIADIDHQIDDWDEVKRKISLIVPIGPHREELLADLQKISQKSGILLANVSFGEEGKSNQQPNQKIVDKSSVGELNRKYNKNDLAASSQGILEMKSFSVRMSLIGSYNSLKNFIGKISNYPRVIIIDSISFSLGSSQKLDGTKVLSDFFNFSVVGRAYYQLK